MASAWVPALTYLHDGLRLRWILNRSSLPGVSFGNGNRKQTSFQFYSPDSHLTGSLAQLILEDKYINIYIKGQKLWLQQINVLYFLRFIFLICSYVYLNVYMAAGICRGQRKWVARKHKHRQLWAAWKSNLVLCKSSKSSYPLSQWVGGKSQWHIIGLVMTWSC